MLIEVKQLILDYFIQITHSVVGELIEYISQDNLRFPESLILPGISGNLSFYDISRDAK